MVLVSDKELLPEHSGGGAAWEGGEGDDVVFWLVLAVREHASAESCYCGGIDLGDFRHSEN